MFLNRLNQEEKVAFLELAHYIARSDEDFDEEQKEIIATYCAEMQISDINYDESKFNLENTLLKITSKVSQKIVVLEVMALIYSDNILHIEEKRALDKIVETFDLSQALVETYTQWSKSMLSLSVQGEALINL